MGPLTKLAKRMTRGDPGINQIYNIAKQHEIDYFLATNLRDRWKADTNPIKAIDKLHGRTTRTEKFWKNYAGCVASLNLHNSKKF